MNNTNSTPITLLQTKLYMPPLRAQRVARPRLIEQLNAGSSAALTLVSAPAGFGKTSLVVEWLSQWGADTSEGAARAAWLSLDEQDNDPIRFFTYVVAAVQRVDAALARGLQALLDAPQPLPVDALATELVNDLAQHQAEPIFLVLDDYHLIQAQSIHDTVAFLVENGSAHLRMVLNTRSDPPLPVARWRVRGALNEIRAADLRFTAAEIATLFQQARSVALPPTDLAVLEARTEGWAASLQLATMALTQQADADQIHRFIESFRGTHRHLVDYLVSEVLAQQPPDVQTFLLRTSILPRLCADLCDALWADEQDDAPLPAARSHTSQHMLEQLERANLFLIPLDAERTWYRYHHLFADLLRLRLRQEAPDAMDSLYLRASAWYAEHGYLMDAIDMALAAHDMDGAAVLIEQTARGEVWQRGEWALLERWLTALPAELVRTRPQLCLYHAWGLLALGRFDAVLQRVRDAEAAVSPNAADEPAAHAHLLGQAAAIRATVARVRGDHAPMVTQSQRALDLLPSNAGFWRTASAFNLGAAYYLGDDHAAAEQWLRQTESMARADDNPMWAVVSMGYLAQIQVRLGRLSEAARLYQQALERGRQVAAGRGTFNLGMTHVGMGDLWREWNDLTQAEEHLQRGLHLGQRVNNGLVLLGGNLALARVRLAQGDPDGAAMLVQQVADVADSTGVTWSWHNVPLAADLARLWLALGQLATAEQTLAAALPAEDALDSLPGYWRERLLLARARILLAQGQPVEAASLLADLAAAAQNAGRVGSLVEILVVQSLASHAQADSTGGVAFLARALQLAEPAGYVRVFVDEGEPMAQLLRMVAGQESAPVYAKTLLAAWMPTAVSDCPTPEASHPPAELIEPLTERELELLRLVAAGHSNQEIADELVITYGTVRRHLSNIYGKLGVNSRAQAILKAQTLNLV